MGTETIPKNEEGAAVESPTDLEFQISRQIEYYFGNYNLSRDKFLKEQIKVDDGWVPLETMVKFNRLKKLSQDFEVIANALKKSPTQLMEVSEDGKKIRRRTSAPIPDDYRQRHSELDEKTLYVKGFKKTNTLDELLEFFKSHKVEHVFMRKRMQQNGKPFRGSVFATFDTKDDAEKFLETKGLKYCGTELLKERKKDYVKRKDEHYKNLREEKEKKKLKKAGLENSEQATEKKVHEIALVEGCLLKLSNLDKDCTREDIKEAFEPYGTLVYVDYSKGNPSAVIRFDSGVANAVLEKLTEDEGHKKIEIGSCTAVVCSVEGEEEKEYWKVIAEKKAEHYIRFSKNPKNFGNKGRFKKWGNKRQKEKEDKDGESEGPSQKRKKMDPSGENEKSEENDQSKIKGESEEPSQKRKQMDPSGENEKSEENVQSKIKGESEEPAQKRKKMNPSGENEKSEENDKSKIKGERSEENNESAPVKMDVSTDKETVQAKTES